MVSQTVVRTMVRYDSFMQRGPGLRDSPGSSGSHQSTEQRRCPLQHVLRVEETRRGEADN